MRPCLPDPSYRRHRGDALLAADASAADGAVRGGLEGSERPITVVFVDMRGSTALGEAKLPYDVLFILNQFFHEMTNALTATHGHYSQFTGDGLMALYGLYDADPATGAAEAVRGAREMLTRLEQLNHRLRADLREPLRIGIGIHHSEAIVGAMGPPRSQIITRHRRHGEYLCAAGSLTRTTAARSSCRAKPRKRPACGSMVTNCIRRQSRAGCSRLSFTR